MKTQKKARHRFSTAQATGAAFLILLEGYILITLVKLSESITILYPLLIPCFLILVYVFVQMYKYAKSIPPAKTGAPFKKFGFASKASFGALFILVAVLSIFLIAIGIIYQWEYFIPLIIGIIGIAFLSFKVIKREWAFRLVG